MPKRINAYTCPDGHTMITRKTDRGSAPLAVKCKQRGCKEKAITQWYHVDQNALPDYEFVIPTLSSRKQLSRQQQQSVAAGGLVLKAIKNEKD
jgi:hypothetical protein